MRFTQGSRQTVSSELTPRGVSPQLTVCQSRPHCLRRFYHARTMTGREYHYSLCGLLRNRELPDILSRHFSLSAFRQVVAYRCTRLCSSQSQRGSVWRMIILLSRNSPVFATQRKTGERGFKPLHLFAHSKSKKCSVKFKNFSNPFSVFQ